MDAHVQFLLHHLWPSPAAIRARLPRFSAPGFMAGQITTHQYSLHATACRVGRLSTRSRQYNNVRGFYIRAFPTSGHPKVKSDITTQPTGPLLWWDFHPLAECLYGLHRPPGVKPLFSLLATSPNPFLWLIELAASLYVRPLFASDELLPVKTS
jgi:hypothetical protein